MSRYDERLLMLQLMAEECVSAEQRAQILGEVAALMEARAGIPAEEPGR